LSAPFVDERD